MQESHPAAAERNPRATDLAGEDATASGGVPLHPLERAFYETRLHHDFSRVRIHSGSEAREMTEPTGSDAVTIGDDIYLADGGPSKSTEDETLLAHELTHVAQHDVNGETNLPQARCETGRGVVGKTPPESAFEDAEGVADENGFVLFELDCVDPLPADLERLDKLIAEQKGPVRVEVHGYASVEGDSQYNRNISAHRAIAVKHYLLYRLPANSEEPRAFAHGATVAFGKTLSDNQRVGVKITPMPPAGSAMAGGSFGSLLDRILDAAGRALPPTFDANKGIKGVEDKPPGPPYRPRDSFFPYPLDLQLSEFDPITQDLAEPSWSHDQPPSLTDQTAVLKLAEENLPIFRGLLGRTGRLPIFDLNANELANKTAAFALSNQLSLETPTPLEVSNQSFGASFLPPYSVPFGEGAKKRRRRRKRLQDQ